MPKGRIALDAETRLIGAGLAGLGLVGKIELGATDPWLASCIEPTAILLDLGGEVVIGFG